MLDLGLQDLHVLVTGANGGIGLQTVKSFLDQGAKVTAHYNTTSSSLESDPAIQNYNSTGGLYQAIQADVTSEEDVERLFRTARGGFGGEDVKVVVVNHAIYLAHSAPLHSMSLSQFERTHKVNLTGSFLVIREFFRGMHDAREKSGVEGMGEGWAVVLVGSTAGEFGEADHADYASSKSALTHGLALSLKNEIVKLHPRARVNTIAPGWVRTVMAEESMKDENIRYMAMATTPLNKIAEPEEVAMQIVLLASQKVSGHLTGQIVRLHGGMEGRLLNPK